jgi:solute carrier family 25 iron transporter 28/37
MYPVDTLKTHVQCDRCGKYAKPGVSIGTDGCIHALKTLVRAEGLGRLWRGVSSMFVGCVPAHAAYFSIFEEVKRRTGADRPGHSPWAAAAAGLLATAAHDAIMTPFDTVKQRLQLGHYEGVLHCLESVARKEGFGSLYVALPTTMVMNWPVGAATVAANETFREVLRSRRWLTAANGDHTVSSYLVAGSGAGAIAALATTPLDMIKTRLQTQGREAVERPLPPTPSRPHGTALRAAGPAASCSSAVSAGSSNAAGRFVTVSTGGLEAAAAGLASAAAAEKQKPPRLSGAADAARAIYKEGGFLWFWRGAVPRLLVSAPSVAVSWTAYECAKGLLKDAGV